MTGQTSLSPFSPVLGKDRISSMDVLRGTALLGIALMNIVFSGLPLAADQNPTVAGGATGANLAAWFLQYILFDGKMRGIFSIMFGAGSYYFIMRGEKRGVGIVAAETYYRRTLWLLLFGMVHAYFIWHGDILYPYALLGLILFPLHGMKPKSLFITAGVLIVVMTGMTIGQGFDTRRTHDLVAAAEKNQAEHKPVTEEQKDAQTSYERNRHYFDPSKKDLEKEVGMYRGSYDKLMGKRAAVVREWHSQPFYATGYDMLTMMLIGIAFAKMGVLTAERSYSFYRKMLLFGYGLGLPISITSSYIAYTQHWEPMRAIFTFSSYQAGRVCMTIGHTALLLLICKAGWFPRLTARLAAVGQMAFSNYIAHSIIYGFVFYGYGFGLYNKLQRFQLYYVVLGMWIFSLIVSPIWLSHFRYGPLEWCWRSLTYWKRQPMRIRPEESAPPAPPVLEEPEAVPVLQEAEAV